VTPSDSALRVESDSLVAPVESGRALRIPRPDGGTIILEIADVVDDSAGSVDAYFDRARAWFDRQPEELALFEQREPFVRSRRELAGFAAASQSDPALAPPFAKVALGLELPQTDEYSATSAMAEPQSAVEGDRYHATGAFERRSVSSYIIARPEERVPTETGLALQHVEGELVATVEMRPLHRRGDVTDEALARVAEIASHLSPLDDDLLDLLVSNARKNGVDANGWATIVLSDIAEARDTVAYRHLEDGRVHRDGIRRETLDEIYERLRGLELLHVYVGRDLIRGAEAAEFDRVFAIRRVLTDPDDPSRVIAIRYEFGTSSAWRTTDILAPTRLLQLDARRSGPAKKVGRYFFQHARKADAQRRIVLDVRTILADLRRPLDDPNPKRGRRWLEDNLQELVRECVLDSWGYIETGGSHADGFLGRYGWWKRWLELHVYVVLPAPTTSHDPTLDGGSR
jgi:hypothetical protein